MSFSVFYENYYFVLQNFVRIIEIILNTMELLIIVFSIIKATKVQMVAGGKAKDIICKGVSYALNYNLATEVMKIIILREAKELLMLFGILILKILIVCLFMLEDKHEVLKEKNKRHDKNHHKEYLMDKVNSFFTKITDKNKK